ncbi:MAG TPA: phytoene desaturase family protein [Polyangiaceae bacterium]|nr:phytoene desaturase family protein [Polyangiaceae bacterium]
MNRAIVIGAGFGGLAAAVRLRALGYEVTVLEAGSQPGGRARVFQRDGFTFDAGPTVVTAPYLFDELFEKLGRRREDYIRFVPVDPFYRVTFADGGHFDYVGNEEALLAQIKTLSPKDVDGYRRMAKHAEQIFDTGYTQLADQPFGRLSDMFRILPELMRVSGHRSVYDVVARYISDERLRQVFTFEPLLIGGNPMRAPAIYLLIHWLERKWGVHYAMGGTGSIVRGLVQLLGEFDVPVRLGAAVSRIDVYGGSVRGVHLESGEYLPADLVVSNADPTLVHTRMLDPLVLRRNTPSSALRKRHSMSLFVGYFGTNRKFPDTKHHTIVLGPRYRELLRDIFDRRVLAKDFSLYLHAPGRTDPAMAPPGKDAFYVLSPVPNQSSGVDWEKTAEGYFDRILEILEQRELPGLRESIVTRFSVDPRYFETELRSHAGAAFGLEPVLTQSAYFRYHNASPDVEGLYFVGASTHPGAGMPGVLCSAKVLERVVPRPHQKGVHVPSTLAAAAGVL